MQPSSYNDRMDPAYNILNQYKSEDLDYNKLSKSQIIDNEEIYDSPNFSTRPGEQLLFPDKSNGAMASIGPDQDPKSYSSSQVRDRNSFTTSREVSNVNIMRDAEVANSDKAIDKHPLDYARRRFINTRLLNFEEM